MNKSQLQPGMIVAVVAKSSPTLCSSFDASTMISASTAASAPSQTCSAASLYVLTARFAAPVHYLRDEQGFVRAYVNSSGEHSLC